jgi:membrane fusion protein, multidrug efflux system
MHDIAQAERSKFKMKSTRKSVLKAALGLGILVVVLLLIKGLQIFAMVSSGKKAAPPPVTVTSAVVKEENWAPILSAVGTVSAVEGAIVATELGGVVSEIDFESGASAKKGDILMKLDTSSEGAQLRTAEAELKLARQDLERTRDLATRRVISQAELDAGESKLKQKE